MLKKIFAMKTKKQLRILENFGMSLKQGDRKSNNVSLKILRRILNSNAAPADCKTYTRA